MLPCGFFAPVPALVISLFMRTDHLEPDGLPLAAILSLYIVLKYREALWELSYLFTHS